MRTIGITGAQGMIGFHVRSFLHGLADVRVLTADREVFSDRRRLIEFAGNCDAVIHLAGLNRAPDADILKVNNGLAEQLVDALIESRRKSHVLFSSSTHVDRDSAYGQSKRDAAATFKRWAEQSGGTFTNLILPHVFGEFGKPQYNSVVSTFCHQIAHGEQPLIDRDGQLELLHAQQVAVLLWRLIKEPDSNDLRVPGFPIRVSELLERLQRMAALYAGQQIPEVRDEFSLLLFNTYRSYLFPKHYPVLLKIHSDARGALFEAVKSGNGGQSFVSTTHPRITRGNHYHLRKVERFLVIGGEAVIRIRKLFSSDVLVFPVSGSEPRFIDIPTMHTHNISNTGSSSLMTLFWSHEIFDPANPDTYAETV